MRPAYRAFVLFNEIRKLGREVKSASSEPNLYVLSARNGDDLAVMLANCRKIQVHPSWNVTGFKALSAAPDRIDPHGLLLVRFRKKDAAAFGEL